MAYYWLQGQFRVHELKRNAFSVEGLIGTSPKDCEGLPKQVTTQDATYSLVIENNGGLPIEKVRVAISKRVIFVKGRQKALEIDPKKVKAHPPLYFEIEKHDESLVVMFKDAIPPHTAIFLTLAEYTGLDKNTKLEFMAPFVWVSSEVSGTDIWWVNAHVMEYDCP
jgi:hypothetical protein